MNHHEVFQELQGLELVFPNLKVLRKLGRGGVCSVFEILDMTHDRLVALKIMHADIVRDATILGREPEMMQRFHQECRLGVELPRRKVPRIPQVYADFKLGERPAVLMQFIRGLSLDSLAPVMEQWAGIAMIHQVAESLKRLHEENVIHGDLTPENTILDSSGIVWILDLGIARTEGQNWPKIIDDERPVYGKQGYTAPEILKGTLMMSRESDMYTMGMFMIFLMIGRFPDKAGYPGQSEGFEWLADDLGAVCMECLSTDPVKRPDSRNVFGRIDSVWKDGQRGVSPQEYLARWQTRVPGRETTPFPSKPQIVLNPDSQVAIDRDQPAGGDLPDRTSTVTTRSDSSEPDETPEGAHSNEPAGGHEGFAKANRWFSMVIPIFAVIVLVVTLAWMWMLPETTSESAGGLLANDLATGDADRQPSGREPLSVRALTMAETGELDAALDLLDTEGISKDDYLVRLIEAARIHEQLAVNPVEHIKR